MKRGREIFVLAGMKQENNIKSRFNLQKRGGERELRQKNDAEIS